MHSERSKVCNYPSKINNFKDYISLKTKNYMSYSPIQMWMCTLADQINHLYFTGGGGGLAKETFKNSNKIEALHFKILFHFWAGLHKSLKLLACSPAPLK